MLSYIVTKKRFEDLRERDKISKTMKDKFANDSKYRSKMLSHLEDIHFLNTLPERVMKRHYDKFHVKYKFQHYIRGVGLIDFYLPETNTVVFVDGCYWHSCPICNRGIERRYVRNKDARITKYLLRIGYNVKRIWEHEIREKYFISWREEKNIIMVTNDNVNKFLRAA